MKGLQITFIFSNDLEEVGSHIPCNTKLWEYDSVNCVPPEETECFIVNDNTPPQVMFKVVIPRLQANEKRTCIVYGTKEWMQDLHTSMQ